MQLSIISDAVNKYMECTRTSTFYLILDSISLLGLSLVLFYIFRKSRRGVSTTPPGPSGHLLVGNTYQIPHDKQWLKFDEWYREYGDIVQISVMGQPNVILSTVQAANDLLDNKGNVYSDRPSAVMAGELVGWNRGLGYSPMNDRFKEFRRLFHHVIGPRPSQNSAILSLQERGAIQLLGRILDDPPNFATHARQTSGAVLLKLLFDYDVKKEVAEDPLVIIVEKAMQGFSRASEPGAFLVDVVPVLKYVPEWIPGAKFKALARKMFEDRERLYNVPFDFVKKQMLQGSSSYSFTSACLEEKVKSTVEDEDFIKAAAASLYSGGADTTPSSIDSFILAMTLNPSVQARAQAEIDGLLAKTWNRLPTFSDRKHLPFINALILEILRWNPAVPLGLAHKLTQDDIYRNYYIRKGTIVWANIWTMLHDEKIFKEPYSFIPERYLDSEGKLKKLSKEEDPILGFGFGRRVCPGMYFADNAIFIAVAMMLYVFNITKAKDQNGVDIIPEVEYEGFICHPKPFQCTITPRSKEAEALIRRLLSASE
ncbi:cytochrome P450 [Abortiporus biennis]|nr:cytochrome P450 [Abortiporus biennis]